MGEGGFGAVYRGWDTSYYRDALLQIRQAKDLELAISFIGSDAWGSEEFLGLCGDSCDGNFFSGHFAADNTSPVFMKFAKAFETR